MDHFYTMNSIIDCYFPTMKDRLNYIVLDIQDPEKALADGLVGREGKDGLEDSMELLEKQIRLYDKYTEAFRRNGYNVMKLPTYHTNPNVLDEAAESLERLWEDKACAVG